MIYEEMELLPENTIVRVYDITGDRATIFCKDKFLESRQGWFIVDVNRLLPKGIWEWSKKTKRVLVEDTNE